MNNTNTPTQENNKKYSFNEIWTILNSDKYDTLPQDKISFSKLSSWGKNHIKEASNRTLENRSDILEPFEKLAHPNGICFKGTWAIDTPNIYSGYFKYNTKAPIIARASSAMSNTKSGENRSFGFAGKIFASQDQDKITDENTANFFLIDDLGGSDATHYTDVVLTNEPKSTFTLEVMKNIIYGLKVISTFEKSDQNAGIRQLYEISYLQEDPNSKIITPKWMKLQAQKGQTKDISDFRDELTIAQGDVLVFDIFVANKEIDEVKNWQKIGTITLDSSVVSYSCDHRLHFHHPKWKNDLEHE
jgi:hypothetical protein